VYVFNKPPWNELILRACSDTNNKSVVVVLTPKTVIIPTFMFLELRFTHTNKSPLITHVLHSSFCRTIYSRDVFKNVCPPPLIPYRIPPNHHDHQLNTTSITITTTTPPIHPTVLQAQFVLDPRTLYQTGDSVLTWVPLVL